MKFTPLTIFIWVATGISLFPFLTHATDKRFCAKIAGLPSVPAFAKQPEQFVPAGWKVVAKKVVDLDGDYIKDVALIIESTSPWPTLVADGDRQVPNTENFHRWFLLLKGQQKGYSLWAEDSQLLGSDAKGEQPHDDEHPFIVASSKQLELGIQFLRGHESAVFKLNRQHQWQLSQKVMAGVLADEFIERTINFDKGVVKDQTSNLNASTATRELPQVKGKFALIRPLILGKDCLEDIENQYIQPIASLSEQTWLR